MKTNSKLARRIARHVRAALEVLDSLHHDLTECDEDLSIAETYRRLKVAAADLQMAVDRVHDELRTDR